MALLQAEPPQPDIQAVYFGLFDAEDDEGNEGIGYYVAGALAFEEDDPDSLVNPAWWPEGRYLDSRALDTVKAAELAVREAGRHDDGDLLGYAGQLGAALLISRFASAGLFPGRQRVVGFDDGDLVKLDP